MGGISCFAVYAVKTPRMAGDVTPSYMSEALQNDHLMQNRFRLASPLSMASHVFPSLSQFFITLRMFVNLLLCFPSFCSFSKFVTRPGCGVGLCDRPCAFRSSQFHTFRLLICSCVLIACRSSQIVCIDFHSPPTLCRTHPLAKAP